MMTYKEHIYEVCKNTDLDNKDEVLNTMQYLARELMRFQDTSLRMDEKMKEIMTAKDYAEWVTAEAKRMMKNDIENMEDGEFKTFCEENFDIITDESLSTEEALRKIGEKDA